MVGYKIKKTEFTIFGNCIKMDIFDVEIRSDCFSSVNYFVRRYERKNPDLFADDSICYLTKMWEYHYSKGESHSQKGLRNSLTSLEYDKMDELFIPLVSFKREAYEKGYIRGIKTMEKILNIKENSSVGIMGDLEIIRYKRNKRI